MNDPKASTVHCIHSSDLRSKGIALLLRNTISDNKRETGAGKNWLNVNVLNGT